MLTTMAIVTGITPASNDARAPQMRRDSTSRPTSSVPSRWTSDGALRTARKSVALGSNGASAGAATAIPMNPTTTANAIEAAGRRRSSRIIRAAGRASSAESRIREEVEDVGEQIQQDEQRGRDQH